MIRVLPSDPKSPAQNKQRFDFRARMSHQQLHSPASPSEPVAWCGCLFGKQPAAVPPVAGFAVPRVWPLLCSQGAEREQAQERRGQPAQGGRGGDGRHTARGEGRHRDHGGGLLPRRGNSGQHGDCWPTSPGHPGGQKRIRKSIWCGSNRQYLNSDERGRAGGAGRRKKLKLLLGLNDLFSKHWYLCECVYIKVI